jgi:hypothetical protein
VVPDTELIHEFEVDGRRFRCRPPLKVHVRESHDGFPMDATCGDHGWNSWSLDRAQSLRFLRQDIARDVLAAKRLLARVQEVPRG